MISNSFLSTGFHRERSWFWAAYVGAWNWKHSLFHSLRSFMESLFLHLSDNLGILKLGWVPKKELHLQMDSVSSFLHIVPLTPNLLSPPDAYAFLLLAWFSIKLLYHASRKCPSVYLRVCFCIKTRAFWSEYSTAISRWRCGLYSAVNNEGLREDCICDGCLTIKNLKLNVEELEREAEVLKRINECKRFINETWLVLNEENEKQQGGQWKQAENSL